MKIVLLKSWWMNVGDGFVKKGAIACLKRAFPDAEIIEASALSVNIKSRYHLFPKGKYGFFNKNRNWDLINLLDLLKPDLIVMAGCILNTNLANLLSTIRKVKSVPMIFLGAGGPNYDQTALKKVNDLLSKIKPDILVSRDKVAYKNFNNNFKYSYDGIDCGFFVNESIPPTSLSIDQLDTISYIISTFHKTKEPDIETNSKIIRLTHRPLTLHSQSLIKGTLSLLKKNVFKRDKGYLLSKSNMFLSDSINEYLYLYNNAKEVHSDMVHACVAALSFQTPCRFYFKTPRAYLFERLCITDISKKLTLLDGKRLEDEKEKQALNLKRLVNKL